MKASIARDLLSSAIVLALGTTAAAAADLYYQPFNIGTAVPAGCHTGEFPGGVGTYPFPADWSRFNVDGRTPSTNVSYVNNAWIVREDFKFDVTECAAFSTSWYAPVGQADDWMWSPAITLPAGGGMLRWRAVAYDPAYRDGYEVRVKTGVAPTQANQTSSTVVFSVSAEEASWTQHTVDLTSYAGQAVYVGFRNNSNDKFLLLVDDVRVFSPVPDLAAIAPVPPYTTEYARMPLGMDATPTLAVTAANIGGTTLTNIVATAEPRLDGAAGGPATTTVAPLASLAIGASAPLAFQAPATFSGAGTWTTVYQLSSDQTASDADPSNDTIEIPGVTIGGNELARWEGPAVGTLGIGAGNGGEYGVQFTIPADGWYAGAHFGITAIPPETNGAPSLCPGFNYVVNLRAFDTASSKPGALIGSTEPVACEYDVEYSVDAPFVGGPFFLTAGTYVVTMVEPVGGPTLRLMNHDNRFKAGTGWVTWPTSPAGGWANVETFGSGFAKTPQLSLLSGEAPEPPIFVDGFDGAPPVVALRRMDKPLTPMVTRPVRKPAPMQLVRPDRR